MHNLMKVQPVEKRLMRMQIQKPLKPEAKRAAMFYCLPKNRKQPMSKKIPVQPTIGAGATTNTQSVGTRMATF